MEILHSECSLDDEQSKQVLLCSHFHRANVACNLIEQSTNQLIISRHAHC